MRPWRTRKREAPGHQCASAPRLAGEFVSQKCVVGKVSGFSVTFATSCFRCLKGGIELAPFFPLLLSVLHVSAWTEIEATREQNSALSLLLKDPISHQPTCSGIISRKAIRSF